MARIAIFLPNLAGGGAERVCLWVAGGLAGRGHTVELVVAQAKGPYLDEIPPGVRVVDLGKRRVLQAFWPLVRYVRRTKPDALLSTMSHVNVVATLACRMARSKARVVLREAVHASSDHQPRRGMGLLIPAAMRRVYPRADSIICVSESVRQDLHARFGVAEELLTTIPNPVDVAGLQEQASQPASVRLPQRPFIVSLGRLAPQKDFATLIRAFQRLDRPADGLDLLILGEGALRPELQAQALEASSSRGAVELPGFVPNPFPIMRRAQAVVLASRWEGMPNVLLQAIALGVPVVATDAPGGTREILERTGGGILTPVADEDAIAQAIGKVISGSWRLPQDATARLAEFADPGRILDAYEAALLGRP